MKNKPLLLLKTITGILIIVTLIHFVKIVYSSPEQNKTVRTIKTINKI